MFGVSKALGAGQAKTYYTRHFAHERSNYYAEGRAFDGVWIGRLAAAWGLEGQANQRQYDRLADGRHPITNEQLVQHQTQRTHRDRHGNVRTTMEHRAGWDATVSAPKSFSVSAYVGGDHRLIEDHLAASDLAFQYWERFAQAKLGGSRAPETTRQLVGVRFDHTNSRPVKGYPAPQMHSHYVVFNLTEDRDHEAWPLQSQELFAAQAAAKRIYQNALAIRAQARGYAIERGAYGEPEIVGYSPEYLQAESPRRMQILQALAEMKRSGAAAAEIAAHRTREPKLNLSGEHVRTLHQETAHDYGDQPQQVVARARARGPIPLRANRTSADEAITFAKLRETEREAVVDERDLVAAALVRTMGDRTPEEILEAFERRVQTPEFVPIRGKPWNPARQFTTPEMQRLETDNIVRMLEGRHGDRRPLVDPSILRDVEAHDTDHTADQQAALRKILSGPDQYQGLDGVAGGGKTRVLATLHDAVTRQGYTVMGVAPTSPAAELLADAGLPSMTLQRYLEQPQNRRPSFLVVDESSLASTVMVHRLIDTRRPQDRVLLVGDVRQHEAVDAGRPYAQLIAAGLSTARLETIHRQTDLELRQDVQLLADGHVKPALARLDDRGLIYDMPDRDRRFAAIAADYAAAPHSTLVIDPYNESRIAINQVIHRTLQATHAVDATDHQQTVLVTRHDMTGADRRVAAHYAVGDVVRFIRAVPTLQVQAGDYARVTAIRPRANRLFLERLDGQGHLSYDPRRLYGVTVYQEQTRTFALRDRVQLTAPLLFADGPAILRVPNRKLGTIEAIQRDGAIQVRLDRKRVGEPGARILLDGPRKHLDLGYALTSYSSQGQGADRSLLHIDTDHAGEKLVNRRTVYVALSRAERHAAIYTNDASQLARVLSRDRSKQSALTVEQVRDLVRTHPGREVT